MVRCRRLLRSRPERSEARKRKTTLPVEPANGVGKRLRSKSDGSFRRLHDYHAAAHRPFNSTFASAGRISIAPVASSGTVVTSHDFVEEARVGAGSKLQEEADVRDAGVGPIVFELKPCAVAGAVNIAPAERTRENDSGRKHVPPKGAGRLEPLPIGSPPFCGQPRATPFIDTPALLITCSSSNAESAATGNRSILGENFMGMLHCPDRSGPDIEFLVGATPQGKTV